MDGIKLQVLCLSIDISLIILGGNKISLGDMKFNNDLTVYYDD